MAVAVLLVEAEESLRDSVRAALREGGHHLLGFKSGQGALKALGEVHPSLAILSFTPSDSSLDRLVKALRQKEAKCQIVWVAPAGGEAEALVKQRHPRGLLARSGLAREVVSLVNLIEARKERSKNLADVPMIVGDSEVITDLRWLLEKVALGGAPTVLITGESGTGKEVVARNLHYLGSRRDEAFVEIDCASVPSGLLESTLFGHEAGAFTDAKAARQGLLELAQGGTVFLDEIGEIDLKLQAKLLRVLDNKRFRPVGGTREVHLDVRWIAATNRDLESEVRAGRFRADLFYRLDVVRVAVPTLRCRGEDILLLARKFLEEASRRLGCDAIFLDETTKRDFLAYAWPGNVRELKNHAERLTLAGGSARVSLASRITALPLRGSQSRVSIDFSLGPVDWSTLEGEILSAALSAANGNVSEAARLLGLGRGAMRYRLSRHDLARHIRDAA